MRLDCPYCGLRDETEFAFGGEAQTVQPGSDASDAEWTTYLYFRDNRKGLHTERWHHARGCAQWFYAVRDTVSHEVRASYRLSDVALFSVGEEQS